MARRRSVGKYLDYKNEVRRIATEFDVNLDLVENAFAVNEIAGREIIDMKDLLFGAGTFGRAAD